MLLLSSADFLKKNSFRNTYQSVRKFGFRLGPNCLQRLSADVKSRC